MRIGRLSSKKEIDLRALEDRLHAIRGDAGVPPHASVIFPVNAQGDLENVVVAVSDVARYQGARTIEVVLCVNNYPAETEPAEVETFRGLGCTVVSAPNLREPGEAPGFTARIHGVRAALAENLVLFDADCRIPNPTELIDWYADRLESGAGAAYTHVGYYDYAPLWAVRLRFAIHHSTRWVKRALLRIPTTRGSNYAARRSLLLERYDAHMLADDMNVGPVIKAAGERVDYSGRRELAVLTSGRMFSGNWRKLLPYYRYRLLYNLRVLRVRPEVARHTGREKDPVRRYVDGKPVT
jgi:hypothetical protein